MLWFSSQAWDRSLVKCHICHLMVHCLQCVVKIILFLSASIINACGLKFSPQGMDSKECTVSVMWADIELPTSWDFWSNPGQILTTQSSFKWKAYSYAQDCQWVLVVVEINLAWAWACLCGRDDSHNKPGLECMHPVVMVPWGGKALVWQVILKLLRWY